jgi:hypothetical protein
MSNKSVFETLSGVDVTPVTQKKGQFDYLSWSNAVRELLKAYPKANWEFREWNELPYQETTVGYFVVCSVTVEEITRSQRMPILDFKNKAVITGKLTSDQVNKAQMRTLAKAIALHGLGLDLWAGEDLMPTPEELLLASRRAKLTRSDLTRYIQECGYKVEQVEEAFNAEFAQLDIKQAFDCITQWKNQQD